MKEAAQEAKEKENLSPVISFGDVKEAAKRSEFVKWQEMWEKSEKGRHCLASGREYISNLRIRLSLLGERGSSHS